MCGLACGLAAATRGDRELYLRVLVGNVVVDAFGAAQDRREYLEMKRNVASAGRRGIAGRRIACEVNFGSPSDKNFATKQQVAMLLGLG
ncbi:Aldehyde dehydrogenase family 2 member B4, mitochondrial [Hordeum vulgare]|nr:Aldehyde dehydrogenase family 2 member B4, mitochondrial [Hordeum vulgare]